MWHTGRRFSNPSSCTLQADLLIWETGLHFRMPCNAHTHTTNHANLKTTLQASTKVPAFETKRAASRQNNATQNSSVNVVTRLQNVRSTSSLATVPLCSASRQDLGHNQPPVHKALNLQWLKKCIYAYYYTHNQTHFIRHKKWLFPLAGPPFTVVEGK
jgi:hypothetical protein